MKRGLECVCVPVASLAEIRTGVRRWLVEDGHREKTSPPLTRFDPKHERRAYLVSDERWTVVLVCREEWTMSPSGDLVAPTDPNPGDALLRELAKLPGPVLSLWSFEHGEWGYGIHGNGEAHDMYRSSGPGGFGDSSTEHLCRSFGLEGRRDRIDGVKRGKITAEDVLLERFVEAIGARGAEVDSESVDDMFLGMDVPVIQGIRVERFWSVKDGAVDADKVVDLHALAIPPPPFTPAGLSPEMVEMQKRLAKTKRRFKIAMLPLWPVFGLILLLAGIVVVVWVVTAAVWSAVERRLYQLPRPVDDMMRSAQEKACDDQIRVEGGGLRNVGHRCNVMLPEGVTADKIRLVMNRPMLWETVFTFQVGDCSGDCTWIRHDSSRIARKLVPFADTEIVSDEKWMGRTFPIRMLRTRRVWSKKDARETHEAICILQTPGGLYRFSCEGEQPIPEEVVRKLKRMAESFEVEG